MPGTTSRDKVDEPCRECRERHLKCDDEHPRCKQCARMNHPCQRSTGSLKFKSGSSAKHDTHFDRSQTWVSKPPKTELQWVDEGPDVKHVYTGDDTSEAASTDKQSPADIHSQYGNSLNRTPSTSTTRSNSSWVLTPTDIPRPRNGSLPRRAPLSPAAAQELQPSYSPLKRPYLEEGSVRVPPQLSLPPIRATPPGPKPRDMKDVYNVYPHDNYDNYYHYGSNMRDLPRQVVAEYERLADDAAGAVPLTNLSPEQWKGNFTWPNGLTTTLCECLMRYFIEELAPWFDAGDPSRTFATAVPYKACLNPPLLNAVFMASSRHLIARKTFMEADGNIAYKGISLPKLSSHTPAKFLDAVIQYLKMAFDQKFLAEDETLAAAVILRFAGDFEESLTGKEEIAVTSTYQSFVRSRAHIQMTDHSLSPSNHQNWMQSQLSHTPQNSTAPYYQNRRWALDTLKNFEHACHRVALRQDVLAGIMYISRQTRKPSMDSMASPTWKALKSFSPQDTEDFIWTDLHLLHLAEVLQFFIEKNESVKSDFQEERYLELLQYEDDWMQNKPYSFAPYHNRRGPRMQYSSCSTTPFNLPNIWLLSEVNLIGCQYINLARIILAELKPSPGIGAERYKTQADIRDRVLSICGMAGNTSDSIFAKEIAYAAITLAGPHFHSPAEQDQLLEVVRGLERDFGWPVENRIEALLLDWGRRKLLPSMPPSPKRHRGSTGTIDHMHLSSGVS